MSDSYEELVRRIAKLVKQNKELKEENHRLQNLNEKLTDENEQLKQLLGKYQQTLELPGKSEDQRVLRFQMATVLFANIHGFSRLNSKIDSQKVIDQLDSIMFHFENIVQKYKVEKIKTIGDTLMCAGGIPQKNITNPVEVVLAALEMISIVDEIQHKSDNEKIWEIKMGIHTGPVTVTLGGNKKSTYEIKGDTVNIATRLESSGVPGNIIISANTYELVKEFFACEYMGKMPIKYHGDIDIYLVKGIKPELSVNEEGKRPNKLFQTRFGLLQFNDLQEIILDRLEKELPPYLYYHNVKHTVDVITEVELIGWGEGVSDEEIFDPRFTIFDS